VSFRFIFELPIEPQYNLNKKNMSNYLKEIPTRAEAKIGIEERVEVFRNRITEIKHHTYLEATLRQEFLDTFFSYLGWDVNNNIKNSVSQYREVRIEASQKQEGKTKRADYAFNDESGNVLFYVEAKAPHINIKESKESALQLRRYGFTKELKISVLTDFEEFMIYNCTSKPKAIEKPMSWLATKPYGYEDYVNQFDFFYDTFSKDAVWNGSLEKLAEKFKIKKGTEQVDKVFLDDIEKWRKRLAVNIAHINKRITEEELNFVVQHILNRIIFLRIAEGRSIEPSENLLQCLSSGNYYQNIFSLFKQADEKYNSGLFDFKKDNLSENIKIENKIVKDIIEELYPPISHYSFEEMPIEVLGSAYERFLGNVIYLKKSHEADVKEKPLVKKAGGVFYTPVYIVDYICRNTIGKLIYGKTPKEISKLKILDPACGSGSFLLGAYKLLLKYHLDYYIESLKNGNKVTELTPTGELTTSIKKQILLNNIFGVDIDYNAVEITKLSLLLKCMEGETNASITQIKLFHERVLPTLDSNIKRGNSLVSTDFGDDKFNFGFENDLHPFCWEDEFEVIFKNGRFDVVIGNPPYVMTEIDEEQKKYLINRYKLQEGKPDLYRLFIEQAHNLLKNGGLFSFIIPNSILTIPACKSLRYYLLNEVGIDEIVNFWGQVFYKVSTNSIILTTQLGLNKPTINLINDISIKPSSETLNESKSIIKLLIKEDILKDENYKINIGSENKIDELNKKILSQKSKEKICEYTLGMQVYHNTMHKQSEIKNRIYHSTSKKNNTFFYESGGSNVKRYYFKDEFDEFVSYGKWCYNKPDWKYCSGERILIREIPAKGVLNCCLTNSTHIPNKAVIILMGNKISNKYLLGLLNSKLIGFYVFNSTEKGKQRLFPRISLKSIKTLPLKKDFKNNKEKNIQDEIVKQVELLLKLNKELVKETFHPKMEEIKRMIKHIEKSVDEKVYRLYDISIEEQELIEECFKNEQKNSSVLLPLPVQISDILN